MLLRISGVIKIYFGLLCLCAALAVNAQPTITITVVTALPPAISESSGLERTGANSFWSHNDSGGQPVLYNFDTTGALLDTLQVTNAPNVDWEELTTDTAGNLYIGDFGNNDCDRQNLVIYKIINPDSVAGNSVTAEMIYFSYPDQYAFPPHPSLRNFDMEAMITVNDSLYLFTKNQTSPCNGYTKVYRLPLDSGTYVAQLVDSFFTGSGPTDRYSLTGARITSDYDSLVLISHERIWFFSGFTGTDFFNGNWMEYVFSGISSNKEGVSFGNGKLYISDEFTVAGTQNLYSINLLGPTVGEHPVEQEPARTISVYPNPFLNRITIQSGAARSSAIEYELLDATGRTCLAGTMLTKENEIDVTALENGVYFLAVNVEGKETQVMKLIKTEVKGK